MSSKPQSDDQQKKATFRRDKLYADGEAERCVLAYCILGGKWAEGIADEHFSLHAHKLIWRAMVTLHARGAAIERPAVAAELHEAETLDAAGGLSYLIELETETGIHPTADIAPYLRRLLDAARRRTMQRHAYALLGDLALGAKSTDELLAGATEIYAKLGTRINTAETSRLASINLDRVQPTISLLNSLAVFGGRIQFESVKSRGPMIVATFARGDEAIWRSMTDLTSFARSQAILAAATGELIPTPSRKTIKAVWEPAVALILQLAGTDRVTSADKLRDEFREILSNTWKRAGCPNTVSADDEQSDRAFLVLLRECSTHTRDPHGPPPRYCIWHDGEHSYVHQPSLVEFLSTPGGRSKHYDWSDVRDALLLLDFVPQQVHRSFANEHAKVRLWRGALDLLVDDESGE
jgi:hypothetical protein